MTTKTRATIDDVLRLGARGERYELIDGELVPMSPTGSEHGEVEAFVGAVFSNFVIPRRLGRVLVGEVLFKLDPAPGFGCKVRELFPPPLADESGEHPG